MQPPCDELRHCHVNPHVWRRVARLLQLKEDKGLGVQQYVTNSTDTFIHNI
jgi:hypothetical protein